LETGLYKKNSYRKGPRYLNGPKFLCEASKNKLHAIDDLKENICQEMAALALTGYKEYSPVCSKASCRA